MKECLELLQDMGLADRATHSTIAMLRDMVKTSMLQQFTVEPDTIHPVIDALITACGGAR